MSEEGVREIFFPRLPEKVVEESKIENWDDFRVFLGQLKDYLIELEILLADLLRPASSDVTQVIVGDTDHGELLGLTDDDHTQYLKEEASGGAASETPDHTHQNAANCAQLDHGAALTGLTDDDHTRYIDKDGSRVYSGTGDGFKDEDDMASDSAVAAASQQSIKAYVKGRITLGPNLISNGTFDTDFTDWTTIDGADWNVVSGKARYSSAGLSGSIQQNAAEMSGVIGNWELYYIKFTISNTEWNGEGGVAVVLSSNTNYRIYDEPADGTYEFFMVGLTLLPEDNYLKIFVNSPGAVLDTVDIDNVELRKITFAAD